ncbi:hypothetical protein [Nocardia caishijiensis]|uniref:Lipoprotein n=1 Tax=Nocardia caishijiensis TaxID=184756 RepID=A0ABQ6YF29_9NOCA|nr:hypothetical protein [Nocardia caishijiensis]KAF0835703.1 hypothetical protein FNL39_1195 [Nocardia caishijiensis]
MSHNTSPPPIRRVTYGLGAAALAASLFGCSPSGQINSLNEAKQIAAACPPGKQIAGRAAIDVSGERLAVAGDQGRLAPVRSLAERVAVCGGHLRIDVFAATAGATAALYDSDLHAQGATEIARLRRVPGMVEEVMAAVTKNLPVAANTLPRAGTDVLAQFTLASEYIRQLDPSGDRYVLDLVISSGGVQTVGTSLSDPSLTPEQAMQLADRVVAPNLSGATVRLTDVGKTPGRSLPTSYVDALKAFYTKACQASRAASCAVVTDAAGR